MRVVIPTHYSRAIARIGDMLARYVPDEVNVVYRTNSLDKATDRMDRERDGDLIIMFVNGMHDRYLSLARRCLARGQRYAVVQIAFRTTRHPKTTFWREFWRDAAVVWSYYPLAEWLREDEGADVDFNFYNAPLGVDPDVFQLGVGDRPYTILTSGFRRNQEGVGECDVAAERVGGSIFQLGPTFPMLVPTTFATRISDAALASVYRQCQFVSGLRRHEGFELPMAEGLLCGARPVAYDKLHYRRWFDGFADFVREGDHDDVANQLTALFRGGPRPVTLEERDRAVEQFSWQRVCDGFWKEIIFGDRRRA